MLPSCPVPTPMPDGPPSRDGRFAELCNAASAIVQLERKAPDTPQRAGQAMDRRNAWLRQVADEAVIVWDGTERRVGDMVRRFERDMPDDVWLIEP